MFIAQAYGIELTFTEQIIGVLTGLLASIGAAGIPMAGLVMISVVLSAMGLPLELVGLILCGSNTGYVPHNSQCMER